MSDIRGARIVRLIEDPNVGGDLLLVGLGIAAKYDFGLDYGGTIGGLARLLWGNNHMPIWGIRQVLRADARTYKPPEPRQATCTAPMIRRTSECGRSASTWGYLTDWATGEMYPAGGCSRHTEWFQAMSRENWAARPQSPPLPCANHGGALVPHFSRIDWRSFWRRIDPRWIEHPETKPWPKPDLTLLLGDTDLPVAGDRPPLAVVPS
jgi:hypothetical protein